MFYYDLLGLVENIRQLKKDIRTLNNRLNELSYVDYEAELNDKRNYPSNNFSSIQVNSANNIDFILINEILYCKAKKNYTEITTCDNRNVLSTSPIVNFESYLKTFSFFRIDKSTLVNLYLVNRFDKKNNQLIMQNDEMFTVARRRKYEFIDAINNTIYKF